MSIAQDLEISSAPDSDCSDIDIPKKRKRDGAPITNDVVIPRYCRPLPSSHSLAALAGTSSTGCSIPPIITRFFQNIGKTYPSLEGLHAAVAGNLQHENHGSSHGQEESFAVQPGSVSVVELDDSNQSTLTEVQHKSFLFLSSLLDDENRPFNSWNEVQRNEYKRLVQLVRSEQEHYHQALSTFWTSQTERLLTGFRKNDTNEPVYDVVKKYSDLYSLNGEMIKRQAMEGDLPQKYGKCSQVIPWTINDQFTTLSLDSIVAQAIGFDTNNSQSNCAITSKKFQDLLLPGSVITSLLSASKTPTPSVACLLRLDDKAISLARTYHAEIVTTEDTLRAILLSPSYERPGAIPLLIPVSKGPAFPGVILERPVLQPQSPRSCLESTVEVGLHEHLIQLQETGSGEIASETLLERPSCQYRYTLLTIPSRTRLPMKIVIRSIERPRVDAEEESVRMSRLVLRVRVEYFPERGCEAPDSIDKSIWVLDHLLGGKSNGSVSLTERTNVFQCRVDAASMKCLGVDSISWSSATTESTRWFDEMRQEDTEDIWRRLASLLSAVRTIGSGRHVILYPGREGDANLSTKSTPVSAVTVHGENTDGVIDVLKEIEKTNTLAFGSGDLARCQKYWLWDSMHRIPYTFPTSSSEHHC